MSTFKNRINLPGLQGNQLLGFLSALGVLRILEKEGGSNSCRLGWGKEQTAFLESEIGEPELVQVLLKHLNQTAKSGILSWHDNILASPSEFRDLLKPKIENPEEDFFYEELLLAFATDALEDDDGNVPDTKFRTMRGAGHQHFLKTMRHVLAETTAERLERTLFSLWDYSDPVTNSTLRFSPEDDRRHAYQWNDPSKETNLKSKTGGMIAANALAIFGLSFFPVIPFQKYSQTTGFTGRKASDCFFRWPIWSDAISPEVVCSVVGQDFVSERSENFSACGIQAIFQTQRLTIGKVRNFTPAKAI